MPPSVASKSSSPASSERKAFTGCKCRYCGGTDVSANVCPAKHPGEFLMFISMTECGPCRNYVTGPLKGVPKNQIIQNVKSSEEECTEYIACRNEHAAVFDNAPVGSRMTSKQCQLLPTPRWVNSLQENLQPQCIFNFQAVRFALQSIIPSDQTTPKLLY